MLSADNRPRFVIIAVRPARVETILLARRHAGGRCQVAELSPQIDPCHRF